MSAPGGATSFQHRLLATLNVRQEEARAVQWLFLHHFLQGFGEALFFTVASALFLAQFAAAKLPWVFLTAAGVLLVVGRLYAWLEHRLPVRRLLPGVVVALVVLVLLAWTGLNAVGATAMAFTLVVLHRVIYLLTNLEFWGVSALLLDVRQGKRLFGLISAGDVPAKLLGYLLVAVLGPTLGLPNLLVLAALAFAASLPVLTRLLQSPALAEADPHHHAHHAPAAVTTSGSTLFTAFTAFFGSPFIVGLAGLSFVAVVGFTCIDFAFLEGAQQRYGGAGKATELARFLGLFLGLGKALTIVTKLFFSGRIVGRLGVKWALLLPPALLLVLAFGTAAAHAAGAQASALFGLFGALLLVAQVFKYTLHDPIFLALFQPLSRHLRLHGHTTVKGVVDPLALGATGALLAGLIWLRGGNLEPTDISRVLIGLLIGWGALVLFVSRQYLLTLNGAIKQRFLAGSQVVLGDRAAVAVVEARLASPHPEEVIYAIELLVKSQPPAALAGTLAGLLHHPAEAVRRQVLDQLTVATLGAMQPAVLALARTRDEVPAVRAAAVRALCQQPADAEGPALALSFLDDTEPAVRRAAIIGLLRSGGLEAVVLAGQQLLQLVEAPDPAGRALAADLIGELGVRSFYQPIAAFLRDADSTVRRAAVLAAGRLANAQLLSAVLDLLPDPALGEDAARALTGFGEAAVPALEARLHGKAPGTNQRERADGADVRVAYAHVLGRIGGARAEAALTSLLLTEPPSAGRFLREAALRALRSSGYQAPARGAIRDTLYALLEEQLQHSTWCLRAAHALAAASGSDAPAFPAVCAALLEEAVSAREWVFRLLALVAPPRTVLKIRAGLESRVREQAANALEILDHLVPPRLSTPLALLLEALPLPEKLRLLAPHVPAPATPLLPAEMMAHVLEIGTAAFHRWTIATVLHTLSTRPLPEAVTLFALLSPYRTHPDALLRQTARGAAGELAMANAPSSVSLSSAAMTHFFATTTESLLEIEKVVVLKSTSMFADTPEHILVDVAAIVREERVTAGQTIFQAGDFGDAMYVIYQGEVRIHAGETTFATFRNRDLFGELALLDPEPRSATATATIDSLLLRLDQEAFYELMAERREVAQGILRMLTRRLRAQNQLLAGKG